MAKTIADLANEMSALADAINRNTASNDAERKQREKDELKMARFEGKAGSMFDKQTTINKRSWQDKRKQKFIDALKNKDKAGAEKIMKGTKAANVAGMISGIAVDAAKKIADFAVKMKEFEIKEQKIKLQAASKSLEVQNALYGGAISKALSIGATGLVGDLKETTYNAMESVMELGKQNLISTIELDQIAFDKQADLQINSMQKKAAAVGAAADAVSGVLGAIPNPYSMIAGAIVSIGNSIFQAETEMEVMKLEYAKEAMAAVNNFKKDVIEKSNQAVKPIVDLTKSVDKLLMTLDDNAHTIGRSFGFYGSQLSQYVDASSKLNLDMADIGKTFEDLKRSQEAYISASGRNVLMNGDEGKRLSSLDMLFNLGDGEAAQIMGAMNIFNTSIESGSDMMTEMYKTANKMGVSNQKFAKDLQKNLKLAEKYQFKGGVEGMMKMSLWAQKVRFNMDSLSAALDKMHTGNIEDVMQTSAKLNVLGGNSAMLSDPMSMLYNAYADPAQYAKNIQQMIQGFGHFNAKTGETEFNINEQMRMEAMASALGISKEEFFNMARQEKKAGQVKKTLGGRFGEEETDLIAQHATFNKKTGTWEVNVMGKNGEVQSKDINSLTEDELKSIFPEEPQKQLVELTKDIFSLLQKQYRVENVNKAEVMDQTQEEHRVQTLAQQGISAAHYERNMDAYASEVRKGFGFSTQSLEASLEMAEKVLNVSDKNGTLTDKYYKASIAGVNDISGKITAFQDAMGGMLGNNFDAVISALEQIDPTSANTIKEAATYANSVGNNKDEFRDAWEEAIDKAQDADIENGTGQYNNKDFINSGYGFFDKNGNFYLNMSHNNGSDYDDMETMAKYVEKGGKYKVDKTTGQVTKVNDLIISPKHGIFETDPEDTIVASKPGGSIDRAEQRRNGTPENINLTVNGTLTLSTGKQSIDLMELLRNDPNALREVTKAVIIEASRTTFGGKHEWAPNRYTFGN